MQCLPYQYETHKGQFYNLCFNLYQNFKVLKWINSIITQDLNPNQGGLFGRSIRWGGIKMTPFAKISQNFIQMK